MLSSKAFLNPGGPRHHLVLIVLNYTLPISTPYFWRKASYKICADGGANRIFDSAPEWLSEQDPGHARRSFMPNAIVGDLDSIRSDVSSFYSSMGVAITDLSHDQDSPDLHKCLTSAEEYLTGSEILASDATILAIGAFGGRIDHTLSNINNLYTHQHLRLVLCGDNSLAQLIPKGHTRIEPDLVSEGPECSVVALGEEALASSTGLQWNLDQHKLAVGGLMSTSNKIVAKEVTIDSTHPLLWTTQFQDKLVLEY